MAPFASRERRSRRVASPARLLSGFAAAAGGRARKLPSRSSGLPRGGAAAPAVSRRALSPWRRLALLPVLALVLGALGLFGAAPAQAQTTVWSATLTVSEDGGYFGCDPSLPSNEGKCPQALTDNEFEYNGVTYRVRSILWNSTGSPKRLTLYLVTQTQFPADPGAPATRLIAVPPSLSRWFFRTVYPFFRFGHESNT